MAQQSEQTWQPAAERCVMFAGSFLNWGIEATRVSLGLLAAVLVLWAVFDAGRFAEALPALWVTLGTVAVAALAGTVMAAAHHYCLAWGVALADGEPGLLRRVTQRSVSATVTIGTVVACVCVMLWTLFRVQPFLQGDGYELLLLKALRNAMALVCWFVSWSPFPLCLGLLLGRLTDGWLQRRTGAGMAEFMESRDWVRKGHSWEKESDEDDRPARVTWANLRSRLRAGATRDDPLGEPPPGHAGEEPADRPLLSRQAASVVVGLAGLLPVALIMGVVLPRIADESLELPTVPVALCLACLAFLFGIYAQPVVSSGEVQMRRQGYDRKMPPWGRALVSALFGAFITLFSVDALPAFNESLSEGYGVAERWLAAMAILNAGCGALGGVVGMKLQRWLSRRRETR